MEQSSQTPDDPSPAPLTDIADWPDPATAALFLDFDGTLVDLAETPDAIVVPPALQGLLARLMVATEGRVVLVSGRDVGDVAGFLPDFTGDIFGGHGAQSRVGGERVAHRSSGTEKVQQMQDAVDAYAADHPGMLSEHKAAGVVLHYRRVPEAEDAARAFVEDLMAGDTDFSAHRAKMAIEIRPTDADKGGVIRRVMAALPTEIVPIYCGDDLTDEAAMAVVNSIGGVTVKVGEGNSCATARLDTPADVARVLSGWIEGAAS